ncbi:MAG: LysE/ArgO family amino acid transporter [Pontibacterium sp.]
MSLILTAQLIPLLKGLATSAGLIVAIGAQNAFVLTQGLKRQYHWPIAGLCSFFDAVLIAIGVAGAGALISQSDVWLSLARWGGALFLFWYGFGALRSALRNQRLNASETTAGSLKAALLTTLAVTLLNPHAYLDTVVIIGSIGGQYAGEQRVWFAAGAISFSFIWFFGLSLGARWLVPLFSKPLAWRILDGIICMVMWSIALGLVLSE